MTIPNQAIREATIDRANGEPGIVIYDVSALLAEEAAKLARKARRDGKKRKRPFGTRDPKKICFCIIHKSGGNGPAGFEGCRSTMSFVVYHRGWEGAAYTFWLSRKPDVEDGRIVVYRMQPDRVKSWHTGGEMNEFGIGIGVQGNYDGEWDLLSTGLPKIEKRPTAEQMTALPLLMRYVRDRYSIQLNGRDVNDRFYLTGHFEHGKRVCPGDALREWLESYRTAHPAPIPIDPIPTLPPSPIGEVDPYRFTPKQYQRALYLLGFYTGSLDSVLGEETRAALEDFQEKAGLKPDGWYGDETARAMKVALGTRDLLRLENFDLTVI